MYWNLIWKSPGFVSFGANLIHFGAKPNISCCHRSHRQIWKLWLSKMAAINHVHDVWQQQAALYDYIQWSPLAITCGWIWNQWAGRNVNNWIKTSGNWRDSNNKSRTCHNTGWFNQNKVPPGSTSVVRLVSKKDHISPKWKKSGTFFRSDFSTFDL